MHIPGKKNIQLYMKTKGLKVMSATQTKVLQIVLNTLPLHYH